MINKILTGNRIKNYNNKNLEAMPVEREYQYSPFANTVFALLTYLSFLDKDKIVYNALEINKYNSR